MVTQSYLIWRFLSKYLTLFVWDAILKKKWLCRFPKVVNRII